MSALVALGVGLCAGAAVLALRRALAPPVSAQVVRPGRRTRPEMRTVLPAMVAGAAVAVGSGWVLAGLAAALIVGLRGRVFAGARADAERRRVEGIALWLEGLRDGLRGTTLTLEHALLQVAESPPEALATELSRFRTRWRHGGSLREALVGLADDLAHPVADSAVAALVFTLDTAGPRAHRTIELLAATARQELAARQRIDRIRAQFERAAKGMIAVAVVLVAYLRFSGDLLAPYRTPEGQLFLVVPLGLWALALGWLHHLARYEQPRRSLGREAEVAR